MSKKKKLKKKKLCEYCGEEPVTEHKELCNRCYDDLYGGIENECPHCRGGGCIVCRPQWFIR